ncbi:hypothetical protein EKO04_003542 [Ascochyta lentis]|uniref:Uncharacterized protein n=1 Tax=Ascochyta lentis TaxID=205686 RepID=A0A8H7JA05_9PLEO|nr:hypothetical protein EKO04_003542 [Ascochyta lentis]
MAADSTFAVLQSSAGAGVVGRVVGGVVGGIVTESRLVTGITVAAVASGVIMGVFEDNPDMEERDDVAREEQGRAE